MKNARDYKDKIDIGIITIRYDEFDAAFSNRFKIEATAIGSSGTRRYAISRVQAVNRTEYVVSLTRSPDQGHGPAQSTAEDMIEDINPRWILVIGIGGCIPATEFCLGDVLVANVVPDFSLQAAVHNKLPSFDIRGGEVHPEVEALVAHLPAMKAELKGWNSKRSIRMPYPPIKVPSIASDSLYGPEEWRSKVINSLSKRFPEQGKVRHPICWTGPIGTSNTLVKDVDLIDQFLLGVRGLVAIEMETGGVRRAARRKGRNLPVMTIRGVSDVIGLKRESDWTTYACNSAASFTYALIRSGQVVPPDEHHLEKNTLTDERSNFPDVSPSRLPPCGKHFVGRKANIKSLDEAWDNPNTRILTICSWTGMGKTALIKYWLASLAKDGWRGVERVFDWSFHNQGLNRENTGSGDAFVSEALMKFEDMDPNLGSPWDRGERLAKLVVQQRTLFILDGLEAVQFPLGEREGLLKDPAIESLLKCLAINNPGLCIITTRKVVTELTYLSESGCPTLSLVGLSETSSIKLLQLLNVNGATQEMGEVANALCGHPLSLMLIGSYLYHAFEDHDARHWREVKLLEEDAEQGGCS